MLRHFLHSKPSYTKFTLATRNFRRMKVFAKSENGILCIDSAYVDKLAKDNNGVKYLLVCQDLFDGTVNAKYRNQKIPRKQFMHFCLWLQKRTDLKILGWQGNGICWRVWKTMQSWRRTNLLYDEWDQGCDCWTYNKIPEKYTLPLHGREWVQVHSQNDSIR